MSRQFRDRLTPASQIASIDIIRSDGIEGIGSGDATYGGFADYARHFIVFRPSAKR